MDEGKKQGWESADKNVQVAERAREHVYKQESDLRWEPHPLNDKVKLAYILTNKEDGVKVTCLLARIPKGEGIPEHAHRVHDIIYPLSGRGKIWIKGMGELDLKRGVLVSVPPQVPHKISDVTEDMEIYDVFSDAIV